MAAISKQLDELLLWLRSERTKTENLQVDALPYSSQLSDSSGFSRPDPKPIYEIKADKEIPKTSSKSKRRYKLQKRISCEELDERTMKGLCVFCGEQETPYHRLQHKNDVILMIDSEDHLSDSMVNKIGNEVGETDSFETEHETMNLVPEAQEENPNLENHEGWEQIVTLEEESIPQSKVPIANFEILKSIEPEKVDLGLEKLEYVVLNENLEQEWDQMNVNEELEVDGDVKRGQKMISDANTCCAHKVLVKMPSKEKRIKHLKGWKFKFKRKSLVGIMLQIEQYKLSKRRRRMYNKLSTNIKDESMKVMITGNHPRMLRQLHKSRVQCKMRMMNDSWSMRQPTLKTMKPHMKHKWKSKHLQIASNFWINHSHKLADLVLRTALTDWRTKNSKGLAYDGCIILETNFAGFGRGKTELLATSQRMQKMDLFSTMLLRVQSKKKQRKGPKSWMFKFKTDSKPARTNHILHQAKKPSKSTKSWKFKFKSENLRKMEVKSVLDNREAVVSVVGEVLFQHSHGLSNRLHRQDLQDLQQFITFGEVTFQIEHKWKFKGKGREVREELSHTSRKTIQEGPSHYFLLVAAAYLTIPMQFGSEGNHVWHRWKVRYSRNFDRVWDPGVSSFFITLRSRFLEGEGFDIGNELRRVAREKEISCWTRGRS